MQPEKKYTPPVRSETKIGNTTFIVNSYYPENTTENVSDKLKRLILSDLQKENFHNVSDPG